MLTHVPKSKINCEIKPPTRVALFLPARRVVVTVPCGLEALKSAVGLQNDFSAACRSRAAKSRWSDLSRSVLTHARLTLGITPRDRSDASLRSRLSGDV